MHRQVFEICQCSLQKIHLVSVKYLHTKITNNIGIAFIWRYDAKFLMLLFADMLQLLGMKSQTSWFIPCLLPLILKSWDTPMCYIIGNCTYVCAGYVDGKHCRSSISPLTADEAAALRSSSVWQPGVAAGTNPTSGCNVIAGLLVEKWGTESVACATQSPTSRPFSADTMCSASSMLAIVTEPHLVELVSSRSTCADWTVPYGRTNWHSTVSSTSAGKFDRKTVVEVVVAPANCVGTIPVPPGRAGTMCSTGTKLSTHHQNFGTLSLLSLPPLHV